MNCTCGQSLPHRILGLIYTCPCGQLWISAERLILDLVRRINVEEASTRFNFIKQEVKS